MAMTKLSQPDFVTTPPVPQRPEPPRIRFGQPFPPEKEPDARRIVEADFTNLATWLIPKLCEENPRTNPQSLVGWLKTCAFDRMHIFLRHNDAVLLMQATISPMEPRPTVEQIFLKLRATKADPQEVRKEQYAQAFELYKVAVDWAKSIRAVKFDFGKNSDMPIQHGYDAVPNAVKKEYYTVDLKG